MPYNFKDPNRNQAMLFPPSLKEMLPSDHFVWFLLEIAESFDLSKFHEYYRNDGTGGQAYDPRMMVCLLFYAYSKGVTSSRVIETNSYETLPYRAITGFSHIPDHSSISRFRQNHENALSELFHQVIRLCIDKKQLDPKLVALDGTKLKANASLSANHRYNQLYDDIKKYFEEANKVDAEEDKLYGEGGKPNFLPAEYKDPAKRKALVKEIADSINRELNKEPQIEPESSPQEPQARVSTRKKRGRKPQRKSRPHRIVVNHTDPQSRVMKTRQGYIQGYNAQLVTTAEQYIVAADVVQDANDVNQLNPMLEQAHNNLTQAGCTEKIGTVLADAGYLSEANLRREYLSETDLIIATGSRKQPKSERKTVKSNIFLDNHKRKMSTAEAQVQYAKRSGIIESTFGQIKSCGRELRTFSRRGLQACKNEFKLIATTHNLIKLWRSIVLRAKKLIKPTEKTENQLIWEKIDQLLA